MSAFVRLTRPQFLLGGALLYAVGAVHAGDVEAGRYLLGQGVVTFAQVTAHYVNEYSDLEADRRVVNRTFFSGGSGVLAAGSLSPSAAISAAAVTSIAAIALAIWLSLSSPIAAVLGLLALAVSWAYSLPPVRLLNTGWGELVTSAVVTGFVPFIGLLVNGGVATTQFGWLIVILFAIHFAMMLAFALPDLETDRDAGKSVLAVRLGAEATRRVMVAGVVVAALLSVAGIALGVIGAALPVLVALVPAGMMVWAAHRDRPTLLTASAVVSLVVLALAAIMQGLG